MSQFSPLPVGSQTGPDDPPPLPEALLLELRRALRSLRYGAIQLVIHDGRVVQLERHEKVRFDAEVTAHERQ